MDIRFKSMLMAALCGVGSRSVKRTTMSVCLLAAVLGLSQLAATVVGGGGSALPKGGKWDLAVAMPEPRQEGSPAALGSMIYLIGGYGPEGIASTLVQVYDTDGKKWKQAAPMPEGLHHIGVRAVEGKIYVVGGFTKGFRDRGPVDSLWQYDPATDRWERRASLPTPRGALAVAVLDGKIYAIGGERFSAGSKEKYEPVADVAVYDPKTDKWEVLPPMRQRRDHLYAGAIGGRVYAVGGRERPSLTLQTVEEYNPATRTWTERAAMPTGRSGGAGAVMNNRLYVFGGEGNEENPLGTFNQVEVYDPIQNAWTKLAPMPLPRHALGAAVIGKRIYLPGGSIVQGGRAPGVTAIMDTFEPD
jgi:N-acetylneuraminic acid mutarotase